MKSLLYIEIDIDFCTLEYGVAPCTATLGVTGDDKCFNTSATCQDILNYTPDTVTLRFGKPTPYLPADIDCIPSLLGATISPGTVSLGVNLGERATLTATFLDHPYGDTRDGYDKYRTERAYNPFLQGTYWGKFRSRQPYIQNCAIRLIRGELGQSLEEMETRHYVVDSFDGPTLNGQFTIKAKDVLKLADGEKAMAPVMSQGSLVADITAVATTATLTPSGIGAAEYPASGKVAIGGDEIAPFTRSTDTLTLTRTTLYGTVAKEHKAQDRVQLILEYTAADPADIIYDLLVNYAGVDPSFCPLAEWQAETGTFLRRVLSARIAEPTSVQKLVSEIIEQCGLAVWWSDIDQKIKLRVLRPVLISADVFTADNVLANTFKTTEQPNTRRSQMWTYFGQINPCESSDDANNYRSVAVTIDAQSQTDYGSPAIKVIYSRWIPAGGRTIAQRINAILLGQYRIPPRKISFSSMRPTEDTAAIDLVLGDGYYIEMWPLQNADGTPATMPLQVTRLDPQADKFVIEAQEALFTQIDEEDLSARQIYIDSDMFDVNARTMHDDLYPALEGTETVTITVAAGAKVGATSTSIRALDIGSWPEAGVTIILNVLGRIQGAGGKGGAGYVTQAGLPGGTALYTRRAITINGSGQIWGGGGGGGGGGYFTQPSGIAAGGGGGGGGQGSVPGAGGNSGGSPSGSGGAAGTTEAPGAGGAGAIGTGGTAGAGGSGGAEGANGSSGSASPNRSGAASGSRGRAIDGNSFITAGTGTRDVQGQVT